MDTHKEVLATLKDIRETPIEDCKKSLFLPPCRYSSGEMVIFLMELKRKYNISLNEYMNLLKSYSVEELATALEQQIGSNRVSE